MKQALLITWYTSHNYGSVLQAYATKEILLSRYCIDTSFLNTDSYRDRSLLGTIRKLSNTSTYKNIISRKYNYRKFNDNGLMPYLSSRDNAIKSLTNKYNYALNNKYINSEKDFNSVGREYDLYIVGSDQLWNPDFVCPHLLLDFVSSKKRKISLSTSLSCNHIPNNKIKLYERYLRDFDAISIRESDCLVQIKNINPKVYCTLDPTLIYGRNNWDKWISRKDTGGVYTLCYILGTNKAVRDQINCYQQLSNRNLLFYPHISDIYCESDTSIKGQPLWDVNPFEWIGYIDCAQNIITDSYHMTLFSIMYQKDFWVVTKNERKPAQSNRLYHILKLLGIENRFIDISQIGSIDKMNRPINWDVVNANLNELVKKSKTIWDEIIETTKEKYEKQERQEY